jgi:sugar lactone lactonase YvrE
MKEPVDIIRTRNTLGEGVLWDDIGGRVWWTDIQERRLHRYHYETGNLETFDLPERLGSFGFVGGCGKIIAAFESGFAFYEPETSSLEWLARPPHAAGNIRFNDGRVDRRGRFWAGSMVEGEGPSQGKLYCFDASGSCEAMAHDIAISNSICFSPDDRTMYFADTPRRVIHRYDIRPDGRLSNRHIFVTTPPGAFPDGSQVDSEGCVWNAHWGAGKLVRYTPAGKIAENIELPVSQPTCMAFGGDRLDLLFVTTAREGLSEQELARQPLAGALFVYEVAVPGLAEPRFAAPPRA